MKPETIALMFNVAAATLQGDFGNRAVYHLGKALALVHLPYCHPEESYCQVQRHVAEAKKAFRQAGSAGKLQRYYRVERSAA